MKKTIFATALAAILLVSGCAPAAAISAKSNDTKGSLKLMELPKGTAVDGHDNSNSLSPAEAYNEQLMKLKRDEYDGIKITATVLNRRATLPGMFQTVDVTIKNTGNKTIVYPHGSGSSKVPSALYVWADALTTVIPEGNLGIMTMDMGYGKLEPGQEISYTYTLAAVSYHPDFDKVTSELFMKDGTYISKLSPDELKAKLKGVTFANPGTYNVNAAFQHAVATGSGITVQNPTGYALVTIPFTVSE